MSLTTSEKTDKLFPAYFKARSSMRELAPTGKNGAFKTPDGKVAKFAPLQTIQRHIEGPFVENGLLCSQSPTMTADGMMVVTTLLVHTPSQQWLRGEFALKPDRLGVHGQVACSTYGRRVALASMLNLLIDEPSDDDGNTAQGLAEGLTSQSRTTLSGITPPTATPKLPGNLAKSKEVQAYVDRFTKRFPSHRAQLMQLLKPGISVKEFNAAVAHLAKELQNEQPTPPVR